ncbi:MAG: AAA family ATPase, partial [Holosporaceae bacterium]|nr:AAA family ATPase [Holosporaceae bacterium]
MAIYSLHVGFVSRSSGRSAVQSAAYICGENLHEERRDKTADYSKRGGDVAFVNTLAPEHSKYKGLEVWNAAENFEDFYADKHFKDENARIKFKESAQIAQTIIVAIPNEFSLETSQELLEKFINTRFVSRGLITTCAIHNSEGNLHAHLQVSRRAIGENGDFVERKDREICTKSALLETRKLWADMANEFLERDGFRERITEKSFADLGINLEATKHRGWYTEIIGNDSRIVQENLEIVRKNEERILKEPSIILDSLNATKAAFTQQDILKEITKRVMDEKNIAIIFEKALEEAKYVGESIKGEQLYTGAKYEQLESDTLTKFEELLSKLAKTVCEKSTISNVLDQYLYLSEEQKGAIVGICGDRNFNVLLGKAGAGKTTTMKAIAEIYQQNGARVIGMSLSAVASENLGKDAGIESKTIASWAYAWRMHTNASEKFLSFESVVTDGVLKQLDWYQDLQKYGSSQLKSGDVIIVDEASMVGTVDWKNILDSAEKFGAKIIAVGDDNQFKSISAGSCFEYFIREITDTKDIKSGIHILNEIHRQKLDWMREASVEFSQLNTAEALAKYEHQGFLHECKNDLCFTVAEKYLEIEKLGTAAILCATKKECLEINNSIRFLKKERGELGEDLAKIGDRLFAENDQIMFLQNNREFHIKNGQVGNVKSFFEGILEVETEQGIKNIDTREYDKIDYAYAMTLHKSQGKTFANTLVLANKMMDASAIYVAMTRHRENVDLYYKKSDFGSFKELINSVSKYEQKDSLVDFSNGENINRSQVCSYMEMLRETASVLKDINTGEATWSDYRELKENRDALGRKILQNYDAHKLYLNQIGITKEKLEIAVDVKQRPLSNVELNAKAASETRSLFRIMKEESFNITHHENYEKYTQIREGRNDLAREILSNYPLHREFVNQLSREYFISRKTMENQVAYAKKYHEQKKNVEKIDTQDKDRFKTFDAVALKEVMSYVDYHNKCQSLYRKMQGEQHNSTFQKNIKNHPDYEKYSQMREQRNGLAREILNDYGSYKKVVDAFRSEYGISKTWMENQIKYEDKIKGKVVKETTTNCDDNDLARYKSHNDKAAALYKKMKASQFDISKHERYGIYREIVDARNELGLKILSNFDSLEKQALAIGISRKRLENQIQYAKNTGRMLSVNGSSETSLQFGAVSTAQEQSSAPETYKFSNECKELISNLANILSLENQSTKQKSIEVQMNSSLWTQGDTTLSAFFAKLEAAKNDQVIKY